MLESIIEQIPRRFSGIAKLYGDEGYARLKASHVIIIGVGGVGSWVAEALARSGVGNLTLIDMDHVAESNINRQSQALDSTLGMAKIEALRGRLIDINPDCDIALVDDFVEAEAPQKYLNELAHFIVDCIDSGQVKAALIAHCYQNKRPIITIGGAGGKTDPSCIKVLDLSRTTKDALLSRTRKILRQKYSFSRDVKRYFSIPAVFSTEQPMQGFKRDNEPGAATGLNCAGFGSATHMTATFAFVAAGYILSKLTSSPQS
ncbi:MAG: tRNA A37 threonylcarbamoyladenosine dehydratase [Cryomorphaceae bacterium]|jgi:tRNA A37 threonylcarbamoyladenosine dehydratase